MRTRKDMGGLTFVEFVVVVVLLLIVGSIFFPVFYRPPRESRQGTCLSQQRQFATAIQMYTQDNKGQLPGVHWVEEISGYIGGITTMYFCPSDAAMEGERPISYGYSGLLLRTDGSGVKEKQIIYPTEVGVLCDASPSHPYPHGGIVSGGGLLPALLVVTPSSRHSKGTIVAYADGHAKYIPREFDAKDLVNGVTRAFYLANAMGLIDNPVGGMSDFTPRITDRGVVAIGGEPCTAPLLRAAAAAWRQKTNSMVTNCGFTGQYATTRRLTTCVWGTGDGQRPAGNAVALARDAVGVIIAKNSKIPSNFFNGSGSTQAISYDTIRQLFGSSGNSANVYQAYTYDRHSGTRAFFTRTFSTKGKSLQIGEQALIAKNDWDMVDKVANDPYAIGYCSAAMADLDRVNIVGLQLPNGRIACYPSDNPKFRYTVLDTPTWPLMRTLYAVSTLPKGNHFVEEMLEPGSPGNNALRAGPLFKASYYVP